MLLVDDVTLEGDTAVGHLHIKGDEYFLQGHFPGNPVVPGVILCEIMGQCCCSLIMDELPGRTPFYAGLDKIRFKNPVRPGDTIEIHGKITARRGLTLRQRQPHLHPYRQQIKIIVIIYCPLTPLNFP